MKKATKTMIVELLIPLAAAFVMPLIAKFLEAHVPSPPPARSRRATVFLAVLGYVFFLVATVALVKFSWRMI